MKFRLFRRRMTISAPRMAVRSSMTWPLRWALVAIVLGFCGAISLWAFELGQNLAGLDPLGHGAKEEMVQLREQVRVLNKERDQLQSRVNTSESVLTSEKAAQGQLMSQIRQLEEQNRSLRDDLGFFEKLLPAGSATNVNIRGLQAQVLEGGQQLKWQVLVMRPAAKNTTDFNGKLELTFSGTEDGKAWSTILPGGAQTLQFKQYRRVEGILDLPPQVVVKSISAKVTEGGVVKTVQTIKL